MDYPLLYLFKECNIKIENNDLIIEVDNKAEEMKLND